MRIRQAVFKVSESRLEVVIQDSRGKLRLAVVRGFAKERRALLPLNWFETLQGEYKLQEAERLAKESGRWVPE